MHTLIVHTTLLIPPKKSSIASITGIMLARPPSLHPFCVPSKRDIHICFHFPFASPRDLQAKLFLRLCFLRSHTLYSSSLSSSVSPISPSSLPLFTKTSSHSFFSVSVFSSLTSAQRKYRSQQIVTHSHSHLSPKHKLTHPLIYLGIYMYI